MVDTAIRLDDKRGKELFVIYLIEFWERFGFYGLQALLVVYLIQALGFSDNVTVPLFGAFSALVYAFMSVGGYLGDKVLGTKRTMFLGAIVLTIGYAMLAYEPQVLLYYGLGGVICGNMLFKANPPCLVSKLYKAGDHRLDSAFTLYYLSINCGSLISMLLCPFIKKYFGWNAALWVSCFGMIVAIVTYLVFKVWIKNVGSEADLKPVNIKHYAYIVVFVFVMVFVSAKLLEFLSVTKWLLTIAFFIVLFFFGKIFVYLGTREERAKFIVCIVLMFEAIIFYMLYQQMPTSLNLFAIRNVHHTFIGIPFEGESFQAFNPLWIIIASPFLAKLFSSLGAKGKDFSMPFKFSFAMFFCSLGFLLLPFAAKFFADSSHMLSSYWLFATYGFQSTGEILIAGLGLSMISKLVPGKIVGFMIGAWYMVSAVARSLGGYVAAWASVPKNLTGNTALSLHLYSSLFLKLGVATLVVSLFMFATAPLLRKYVRSK